MKENQQILQACGERSRTIKQIFFRFSLCNFVPSLRISVFLFLLIAFVFLWQPALAHGGGELQISNAPIGDYQVSIWNNPPTVRAGQAIHVTVGIAQAETGEPVLDAAVSVTIVNESGEPIAAAAATTEQSINRLFYEADLDGVSSGTYEMQIVVTGSDGSGVLSFPLIVEPMSFWPWVVGAAVALLIVWLVLRIWRRGTRKAVSRRRTARTERLNDAELAETAVPQHHFVD